MAYFFLREIEEVIKNIIVLFCIFKMPIRDKKIVISATAAYIIIGTLRYAIWDVYSYENQIIGIIIGYVWIILVSASILWKDFLFYFVARVLINCIDELVFLVVFFCGAEANWLLKKGSAQNILANSVSILIFAIIAFKRKKGFSDKEKIPYVYYTIPCGAAAFAAALMAVCQGMLMEYSKKYNTIIFVVCMACCILLIILGILLMFFLRSRQYYKQLYNLRSKLQRVQSEHFKELYTKTMEFRQLRHDYRHNVAYMSELADAKRWNDITEFLGGMKNEFERTRVITTGCFSGDAVVNHFYERMQEKGIVLDWMGSFPAKMQIEEIEFCSLLSNLLENAVEACDCVMAKDKQRMDMLKKPVIRVEVQKDDRYLFLDISNPAVEQEGGFSLETSKEEISEHGIGTQNVKRIVKKYNGDAIWEFESGKVNVSVYLQYKN